jgi:hypothetical protein
MIFMILYLYTIIDGSALYEHEGSRDIEIIAQDVEQLRRSPIAINIAPLDDLMTIPFLSFSDCQRLINDRRLHGFFHSPHDLERIPGFDRVLIGQILPFITFGRKEVVYDKTTMRLRMITGFPWIHYREEVYGRMRCYLPPYTCYGVAEKDFYEEHYLDYWTAGVVTEYNTGTFAFGKFNLDLGSGVMLSPLGSIYSTTDLHLLIRERGIIPYTSVNENSGFFGAAIADSILLKFVIFYSSQKLDGRIDSLGFVRSLDKSGDHIDSASIERKDRIDEECVGCDIRYKNGAMEIASRAYLCRYEPPFVCTDSMLQFYGNTFYMAGLQVRYTGDASLIFAEVARGHQDRIGGICGICGELPVADISVTTRYFPVGYYSPKGVEASSGTREGIIVIKNRSRIANLVAQIMVERNAGSDTTHYSAYLTAEKKIKFVRIKLQMRWHYQEQAIDLSGSRVFLRMQAFDGFWADIRLEERYVFTADSIDRGLYGCFELGARIGVFTTRMRYGVFATDSYASRLYVYEIDLPGMVNNRLVYGRGSYGFIHCSWKPSKRFTITAKHAIMWKDDSLTHKIGCQGDFSF